MKKVCCVGSKCRGLTKIGQGMPHRANALDNEPSKSIIYNVGISKNSGTPTNWYLRGRTCER